VKRSKVLVVAGVALGALGLVWLVKTQRAERLPEKAKPAGPEAAAATEPGVAPGAGRVLVPAPDVPPAPPVPPQALDRDDEVRTKVDAVLSKYPDVATLKSIECQPTGACQIQVQVDDLDNFRAPLELLQDPESGLSGDHKLMILSKPEALGPKGTAPYIFTFQLTPPEGGVVKP
jgi:hypothetical protein